MEACFGHGIVIHVHGELVAIVSRVNGYWPGDNILQRPLRRAEYQEGALAALHMRNQFLGRTRTLAFVTRVAPCLCLEQVSWACGGSRARCTGATQALTISYRKVSRWHMLSSEWVIP